MLDFFMYVLALGQIWNGVGEKMKSRSLVLARKREERRRSQKPKLSLAVSLYSM